jgi:hypothetical protein
MIKHKARHVAALALAAGVLVAAPTVPMAAGGFPFGTSYLVHLSRGISDEVARNLVEPLVDGLNREGLVFRPDQTARLVASVDTAYDGGRWLGAGSERRFLHTRRITIGLSPASHDVERGGRHTPAFAVIATLATDDTDRTDQFACAVSIAVAALRRNYRPSGQIRVDASSCGS